MADLSITAASVVAGAGADIGEGIAGATITAGQVVYFDSSDNRLKLADCDAVSADARTVAGIALHGASAAQPLKFLRSGDLTINAVMTGGIPYFLSPVAGGICPIADIAVGDDYVLLGIAKSTTTLSVRPNHSGFTRAV